MSDILDVENVRHSRSWECQTFSIFFLPPNLIICIPFDAKLYGDTEYCIKFESWLFYKEMLRVFANSENVRHSRSWESPTLSIFFLPPNSIICIPFDAKLYGDTEYCIKFESWLFYKEILRFFSNSENVRHSQLSECQTFSTPRMSDILDFQNVWHSQLSECLTFSTFRMSDILNSENVRHSQLAECTIIWPNYARTRKYPPKNVLPPWALLSAKSQNLQPYKNWKGAFICVLWWSLWTFQVPRKV